LKFSVADTRGKDDQKKTSWYDIVVFGDQAEAVVENIGKGDRIMVAGRLQVEDYEKKDGTKGKRVEIIADAVGRVVRDSKNPVDQLKQAFNAVELQDEDPF
jgi:single-strand DNA-binding protein